MRLRLYKMELEGKLSVAHLSVLGLVLAGYRYAYLKSFNHYTNTEGIQAILPVLEIIIAVLTFPVGWLALPFAGVSGDPWLSVIFVPFNGYFWGYVVAAVVKRRKSRSEPASSTADTSADP